MCRKAVVRIINTDDKGRGLTEFCAASSGASTPSPSIVVPQSVRLLSASATGSTPSLRSCVRILRPIPPVPKKNDRPAEWGDLSIEGGTLTLRHGVDILAQKLVQSGLKRSVNLSHRAGSGCGLSNLRPAERSRSRRPWSPRSHADCPKAIGRGIHVITDRRRRDSSGLSYRSDNVLLMED